MILEKNKKPGIYYALTDDGVELPVMDITNPAFAETITPEKSAALLQDWLEFQKSPAFFRRFFSRHSIAMRGLDSASGKFLAGMTTYIAKLGPDILGKGYSGWIDRKVASGIGAVAFRLRLQDTARTLAEELGPQLTEKSGCALHLLNFGGGPAMDSLNALILLYKDNPAWLAGRAITIHVLDVERAGPSFGARAAAGLQSEGAPLQGLKPSLEYLPYDWTDSTGLRPILDRWEAGCIAIGSSEGGLFEYGSDSAIAKNLRALREGRPAGMILAGSVFRDGTVPHWLQSTSKIPIRIFEPGAFEKLAADAGWAVRSVKEDNPIYRVISLGIAV